MDNASVVDLNQIKQIGLNILTFKWFKSLLSLIGVGLAYVFDDTRGTSPALIVAVLICLDSMSGMFAAVKSGEGLSSRKSKRIAVKFVLYGIAIITGRLVDKMIPIPAFAVVIEIFLAVTEAQSIIENLGRAGLPIPPKLKAMFTALKVNDKE